jgi:hypothetical protein
MEEMRDVQDLWAENLKGIVHLKEKCLHLGRIMLK